MITPFRQPKDEKSEVKIFPWAKILRPTRLEDLYRVKNLFW